jgi:hypothetical protein
MSNITIIRRRNALTLFQLYAERSLLQGAAPKGLEQSFANALQISPSMWSQIKTQRPIGDKLARQIESLSNKESGWLDQAQADASLSDAERAFLELTLALWRACNAKEKRALKHSLDEQLRALTTAAC